MSRRKERVISADLLDQLLAGGDAAAALQQGGLLDSLKKALAQRALQLEDISAKGGLLHIQCSRSLVEATVIGRCYGIAELTNVERHHVLPIVKMTSRPCDNPFRPFSAFSLNHRTSQIAQRKPMGGAGAYESLGSFAFTGTDRAIGGSNMMKMSRHCACASNIGSEIREPIKSGLSVRTLASSIESQARSATTRRRAETGLPLSRSCR